MEIVQIGASIEEGMFLSNFKKYNTQKGFSLVELIVAAGLMGIVALIGSSVFVNVTKEATIAENQKNIRNSTAIIKKVISRISTRVSHTQYDPFNVVDFENKNIGKTWKEAAYGREFVSGSATSDVVYTQELGLLKEIYNRSNAQQVLTTTIDFSNGVSGCADCSTCETFKLLASTALVAPGKECAPLRSCLYTSFWDNTQNIYKEIISKCEKPPTQDPSQIKVMELKVDKFSGAQTSHDVVFTDLDISQSNFKVSKENYRANSVYMSRCVPVSEVDKLSSYVTHEKINLLRRPFVKSAENITKTTVTVKKVVNGNPVDVQEEVINYTTADLICCTRPLDDKSEWLSNCEPIATSGKAKYLPTIFVYRGENNVSTWPEPSERVLIPGLAFIMQIDSATPKFFKLTSIQIENACKSGRKRVNWPCPTQGMVEGKPEQLMYPADGEFNDQIEIKVSSKSGPVANGVSSGGIIGLGETVNFNP